MKTKFFSVLFSVALFAAACASVISGNEVPKDPTLSAVQENAALLPVTGASVPAPARESQEPRLWSGPIFNSDNNQPDHEPSLQAPVNTLTENACSAGDELVRRQGGCIE